MDFIKEYISSDSEEEEKEKKFCMSTKCFYKSTKTKNEKRTRSQFSRNNIENEVKAYTNKNTEKKSEVINEHYINTSDEPEIEYPENSTKRSRSLFSRNNIENEDKAYTINDTEQDYSDISPDESEYSEYFPSAESSDEYNINHEDHVKQKNKSTVRTISNLEDLVTEENSDDDETQLKKKKICIKQLNSQKLQSPQRMKSPNLESTPKRVNNSSIPPTPIIKSPKPNKSPKSAPPLDIPIDNVTNYVGEVAEFLKHKIENDNELKKYLCGNPALSSSTISTQVHQNNKNKTNRRLYNKYHVCYYCGLAVIKMARHYFKKHPEKSEVSHITDNYPKNSLERKNQIQLLTLKGDFLHNCAVLREQKGVLLVLRRPDANNPTEPTEYIPCIYCLGFVQTIQAYRHAKNCLYKKKEFGNIQSNRIVSQGKVLLCKMTTSNNSSANWQTIQATFRKDEISQYIINDETLFAWGNYLTIKNGLPQAKHIRDKLRTVATFCKSYHRDYGTDDISVRQICQTKNFEKMLATAQQSFGSALTPPVKLGKYMKDLMIILKQQAIYRDECDRQQDIDNFLFLVNSSWNMISVPNTRTLWYILEFTSKSLSRV